MKHSGKCSSVSVMLGFAFALCASPEKISAPGKTIDNIATRRQTVRQVTGSLPGSDHLPGTFIVEEEEGALPHGIDSDMTGLVAVAVWS